MISKYCKINLLLLISILISSINSSAQSTNFNKHVNVTLRKIGHEILLAIDDSTSIVLPIVKNNDDYTLQFDTDFSFQPDSLAKIIDDAIVESKIATSYFVEVKNCDSNQVIYSYKIGSINSVKNIACRLRTQHKDCYKINFTFLNQKITPNTSTNYLTYFIIGLFILAILLLFYFYKSKEKQNLKTDSNIITIGDYLFDNTKMTLIYKGDIVELSSKETDLLFLLYTNKNQVVERDTILKIVWGDEGDYIGRTLDVFVSKLRKKLSGDSNIKIVNSRGVGYKLIE